MITELRRTDLSIYAVKFLRTLSVVTGGGNGCCTGPVVKVWERRKLERLPRELAKLYLSVR